MNTSTTSTRRNYKYYDFVMVAFVVLLLCSNIIGAAKICQVGDFKFGAGIFFFPLSYVFGDILTEVYGFARARKVVWAGFGAMIFASLMSAVIVAMPPAESWPHQGAFETVFGSTWRIALASILAFWAGEFTNSYTLAKLKILTEGKKLWTRTIGSTIAGEFVDSMIFYPIAFYGNWQTSDIITVMFTNYLLKTGWEVVVTPVTYRIVAFLKRAEGEDYYDRDTNFTPFSLET